MDESDHLYILWTNADLMTFDKMVMMYAKNCIVKHWWKEVTVIIWGATAKLVAENQMVRERIREVQSVGVHFSACKSCAEQLGAADKLAELGVEVIYWGEGLTDIIKNNKKLITI